jgi:hypothetical protein
VTDESDNAPDGVAARPRPALRLGAVHGAEERLPALAVVLLLRHLLVPRDIAAPAAAFPSSIFLTRTGVTQVNLSQNGPHTRWKRRRAPRERAAPEPLPVAHAAGGEPPQVLPRTSHD